MPIAYYLLRVINPLTSLCALSVLPLANSATAVRSRYSCLISGWTFSRIIRTGWRVPIAGPRIGISSSPWATATAESGPSARLCQQRTAPEPSNVCCTPPGPTTFTTQCSASVSPRSTPSPSSSAHRQPPSCKQASYQAPRQEEPVYILFPSSEPPLVSILDIFRSWIIEI